MKKLFAAAALVTGFAALALPTLAAHASVTPCAPSIGSVSATTHLTNRPDSGGNGNWATDTLTRTFKLTLVSQSAGIYTYTGTVCDGGTFVTIPGAFTPNQGAPYTGTTLPGVPVKGTVNGTAFFSFTADQPADITLVPATGNPGAPTSTWYQQAFPAGTVFTGGLENNWSWSYQVIRGFSVQNWLDAASNGGGQVPSAGNITG